MQKIVRGLYQITPLEGFGFEVSGPHDPIVSLDGKTLDATEGQPFQVTPDMLSGMGASHFLFMDLVFLDPDNPGKYQVSMLDDQGQLVDTLSANGPDDEGGQSAQVQIKIIVADAAAKFAAAAKPKTPGKAQPPQKGKK
jgi:hypothetical protein